MMCVLHHNKTLVIHTVLTILSNTLPINFQIDAFFAIYLT